MAKKTQSQVVADARRLLEADDRMTAIKALASVSEQVEKKRAELEAAEQALREQRRAYRDTYDRARKANWTVKQLRELGFAAPPRIRDNRTGDATNDTAGRTAIADDPQQEGGEQAWVDATSAPHSANESNNSKPTSPN